MKEARVGHWSEENRKCNHCGGTSGLKLCSGCHKVWFCSNKCQTKDWKGDHKGACKTRNAHVFVEENAQEAIHEIAQRGFVTGYLPGLYPVFVTKDASTGRLFDVFHYKFAAIGEFRKGQDGSEGLSIVVADPCRVKDARVVFYNRRECPDIERKIATLSKSAVLVTCLSTEQLYYASIDFDGGRNNTRSCRLNIEPFCSND